MESPILYIQDTALCGVTNTVHTRDCAVWSLQYCTYKILRCVESPILYIQETALCGVANTVHTRDCAVWSDQYCTYKRPRCVESQIKILLKIACKRYYNKMFSSEFYRETFTNSPKYIKIGKSNFFHSFP